MNVISHYPYDACIKRGSRGQIDPLREPSRTLAVIILTIGFAFQVYNFNDRNSLGEFGEVNAHVGGSPLLFKSRWFRPRS